MPKERPSRGSGRAAYATSTASRPAYQPHTLHTRCGRLTAPHRGQVLCAGADTRQADARRLRPLALDVFFLGTAIEQSYT